MNPLHQPGPSPWNIANLLTGTRIAAVPGFVATLLHDQGLDASWRIAAFLIFVIAVATDRLDGELARRRGLVTNFGKIADPIADKLLIGSALIGLSILSEVAWWVTVVILVREVGITVLRLVVLRRLVISASRGGKLKTFLQGAAISLYLLPLTGWMQFVAGFLLALAVVVTVVTGFDYLRRVWRLRSHAAVADPGRP